MHSRMTHQTCAYLKYRDDFMLGQPIPSHHICISHKTRLVSADQTFFTNRTILKSAMQTFYMAAIFHDDRHHAMAGIAVN